MKKSFFLLLIILLFPNSASLYCQVDTDPPDPPVLNFLTIQPSTGNPAFTWSSSPSTDVAGYVLYYYTNGEGHAFDTIHDASITSYINPGSSSQYWVESYVIAAIDSAGNISPLSNELHTIFPQVAADSCHGIITLSWNSYASYPKQVTGYTIQVSENGGAYTDAGHVGPGFTTFEVTDIKPLTSYCFVIKPELDGGLVATSVVKCRTVQMEQPPDWINADYATVNDEDKISLSFTIDPVSEIKTFWVNRKRLADNDFVSMTNTQLLNNNILFTDANAKTTEKYVYWLAAINRCGIPSTNSNIAANMILEISAASDPILLQWNSYRNWTGGISGYRLFINTGSGFGLKNTFAASDTTCTIDYRDIMNDVSDASICFYIEAEEIPNIHGITGKSRSNTVCMTGTEKITVPNSFTPDNDNLNDLFRPVLSFTPAEYQLIITDRFNNKLFESSDPLQSWDGTKGGSSLPRDVYLWFIRVKTPSGSVISKTGTIAIVKTR